MLISRFTDLSLRVLMYLTYTDRDTLVTVNELSERLHWSRNHMGRIVYFMSTKGWVETHRGRFGGITLKHKPSEYRIGDLVQILEEQGDLIDCFEPSECTFAGHCRIRDLMREAACDFYARLNTATLETLTQDDDVRQAIAELNEPSKVSSKPSGNSLIRQMQERLHKS